MKIRDRVNSIGDNAPHILEWARACRPDIVPNLEKMRDNEGLQFLLAVGYAAGRASVVAEVDGITIAEAARC